MVFTFSLLWFMAHYSVVCDEEPSESLSTNRANGYCLFDNHSKMWNQLLFSSLSKSISQNEYLDLSSTTLSASKICKSDSLIFEQFNIRSLNRNFDECYDFIEKLLINPDIICLTEFRLKYQSQISIGVAGYNFINIRPESNAGGGAMYVLNTITFKEIYNTWLRVFMVEPLSTLN